MVAKCCCKGQKKNGQRWKTCDGNLYTGDASCWHGVRNETFLFNWKLFYIECELRSNEGEQLAWKTRERVGVGRAWTEKIVFQLFDRRVLFFSERQTDEITPVLSPMLTDWGDVAYLLVSAIRKQKTRKMWTWRETSRTWFHFPHRVNSKLLILRISDRENVNAA